MKVVSFNVNGLRARLHQLDAVVSSMQPDIIGLQETKVDDDSFPHEAVEKLGYHVIFHGQKGHYGVALLSLLPPVAVRRGFPDDPEDAQRRLISADFDMGGHLIQVVNGYFPQGESRKHPVKFPAKQDFYQRLAQLLEEQYDRNSSLIIMGDMNIAPEDQDIGIGPDNARRWLRTGKCCFLPEEREWLQRITDWGLFDTYRHHHPEDSQQFSWFDYRSRGFERDPRRGLRIDLILATRGLASCVVDAGVGYDIRGMEKPSDHCPVWTDFAIESRAATAILNK